jgi:protein-S-isoprenylcysteine O-methyltransferase Ste14
MWLPSDEVTFRIAMAALLTATVLVAGYHRVRSQVKGGKFSRKDEPLRILIPLRLLGVAMFVVMGLCFARPAWLAWAFAPLPPGVRWSGLAVGVIDLGLLTWTLHTLGTNLTDTVGTRSDHTLVTRGPYRYIRHPFYTTAFLMMLAMTLLTGCWLLGVVGLAALALLVIRTPIEEAKLIERFGDGYRSYAMRTPRYLPSFSRTTSKPERAAGDGARGAGLG